MRTTSINLIYLLYQRQLLLKNYSLVLLLYISYEVSIIYDSIIQNFENNFI